jgi:NADPH-dependent 2,4-dienoyl-CoA reductase/sulfur reductase-like enzyme
VIVGAGYIGLEMAEALTTTGLAVTQVEQLPEVLPTVDPELGALVRAELHRREVNVLCGTRVDAIQTACPGGPHCLEVQATGPDGEPVHLPADVAVDRHMRTNLPDVLAAGDCVVTHHPLLGTTYLPLGTSAHKQGRIAGENALGGTREFAGSVGTQVVNVFDLVAARTGLRDSEASPAGFDPLTAASEADDHKAYYPRSHKIVMRYTGDRRTGRLLGVQLVGHLESEIAKRIDIPATAIFNQMTVDAISDLDLSYTPPLGSPWDALQHGAQAWVRQEACRRDARSPRRL